MSRIYCALIGVLILLSCEEVPDFSESILFDDESESIVPITSINTTGFLFDTSSITLEWSGNEYALTFSYQLISETYTGKVADPVTTYSNWSEWKRDSTVTLEYLDDGLYTFFVTSRFNNDVLEDIPISISFEVNANPQNSVSIYPLRRQISSTDIFEVYVFVDNMTTLSVADIHFQYDSNKIEFKGSTSACQIGGVEVIDINRVNIYYCDLDGTYDSANALFNMQFQQVGVGNADIVILESSKFRDSDGIDIPITKWGSTFIESVP